MNYEAEFLRQRIARLEAELKELHDYTHRMVKVLVEFDQLLRRHCEMHDTGLADAFERIKALEFHAYPRLAHNLTQLHHIIGEGEEWRDNPLDRRAQRHADVTRPEAPTG